MGAPKHLRAGWPLSLIINVTPPPQPPHPSAPLLRAVRYLPLSPQSQQEFNHLDNESDARRRHQGDKGVPGSGIQESAAECKGEYLENNIYGKSAQSNNKALHQMMKPAGPVKKQNKIADDAGAQRQIDRPEAGNEILSRDK